MRMLAYSEGEEILSLQISVFDFFKSSSGTRALPPVLLGIADDNTDDPPTVQEEVSP